MCLVSWHCLPLWALSMLQGLFTMSGPCIWKQATSACLLVNGYHVFWYGTVTGWHVIVRMQFGWEQFRLDYVYVVGSMDQCQEDILEREKLVTWNPSEACCGSENYFLEHNTSWFGIIITSSHNYNVNEFQYLKGLFDQYQNYSLKTIQRDDILIWLQDLYLFHFMGVVRIYYVFLMSLVPLEVLEGCWCTTRSSYR